jgi:pyruvate/2-oxoglutarate dehydrogenase complex dihydrolipoamide dehydrogenase (E3) component
MIVIGAGKVGLTAGFRSVELESRVLGLEKEEERYGISKNRD